MNQRIPIRIVGGGLAGLTLGIALRRQEVPVTIYEAGRYPRPRVCGEFINGRGLAVLEALELRDKFVAAGAVPARSVVFYFPRTQSPVRQLPEAACCLSRQVMDKLLADEFQRAGGVLQTGQRTELAHLPREGTVCATGRTLATGGRGRQWHGLKMHVKGISLAADLEMHVLRDGYVGLCRLANDTVNVCGLFRRTEILEDNSVGFERLRGLPSSRLNKTLAAAELVAGSQCAVAGISLQRWSGREECAVGDALTMIPPVTGNGMSVAFESAWLASEPLVRFSRGNLAWEEARAEIRRRCTERFRSRLFWAQQFQRVLLSRGWQNIFAAMAVRSNRLWQKAFESTR